VVLHFLIILLVAISVLGTALGMAWWDAGRDFKKADSRSVRYGRLFRRHEI
jgi:hypothetical protein